MVLAKRAKTLFSGTGASFGGIAHLHYISKYCKLFYISYMIPNVFANKISHGYILQVQKKQEFRELPLPQIRNLHKLPFHNKVDKCSQSHKKLTIPIIGK